jgi:hypothetical protein
LAEFGRLAQLRNEFLDEVGQQVGLRYHLASLVNHLNDRAPGPAGARADA